MTKEKDPAAELMRLANNFATWRSMAAKAELGSNSQTATERREVESRLELESHARTMAARIAELEAQLEAVGAQAGPVSLTDGQILAALKSITNEPPVRLPPGWAGFGRAIEAAVHAANPAPRALGAGGVSALMPVKNTDPIGTKAPEKQADGKELTSSGQDFKVTAGWQLVPVEPDDEMLNAGRKHIHGDGNPRTKSKRMYRAMLAAAPKPPVSG
jgi:hypothetical protein